MGRTYQRKTERKLVTQEQLNEAKDLMTKGMSRRKAANQVGLGESALRFRLPSGVACANLGRFKVTFTENQEREIAKQCKELDSLSIANLRRLVYSYAEANKIEHRFDRGIKMAGRDWVAGFLGRHPELGLRQSQPASLARAIGFNKTQIPSILKFRFEMASKSPKEKRAERKKGKEEIVEATNKIYKVVRNKTIAVKQVADTFSMSARTVYRFLKESNAKAYDKPPTNKNQSDIKKPKEDQLLEPDVFIKIENEVLHETDINAVPISQISDNRSFGENIATNINSSRNFGNSPSSSKNDGSDLSVVQPSVFSSFPLKRFDEKSEATDQQQLLDTDVFIKVENEILQETNIDADPIPQTSSFVSFEENIATDSNILPNLRNFQPFSKNDDSMKYRSFESNNSIRETCDQRQTDETKLLSERLKDEAINCMKTYLNDATKRDVHSVFGEYTAQKLRNCCRSLREINVAKELIANVLDRLA